MSDHIDQTDSSRISRREAIKTTAKVAGVAAFATPTIVSVWSTPVLANHSLDCLGDGSPAETNCGSTDSDAVDVQLSGTTSWNTNCGSDNVGVPLGRYNSQRSEFTDADDNIIAILTFGEPGVDNFDVEVSYYTLVGFKLDSLPPDFDADDPSTWPEPDYDCTAYWSLTAGNSPNAPAACTGAGLNANETQNLTCSHPITPTSQGFPTRALPYCDQYKNNLADCQVQSNIFLKLNKIACCPV